MNKFEQIKLAFRAAHKWPYLAATVVFYIGFGWLFLSRWF